MLIKFKTKEDFNHAVTYLINQTYCFDRYDTQLMIRFSQVSQAKAAIKELNNFDIYVDSIQDLLETLSA